MNSPRSNIPTGPQKGGRPGSELPPDLMAEQKAALLKPGDVVAGRFEVVDQLGFGGMGAVYHVRDTKLHNEEKALKVMLPSLVASEAARERFLTEVSISQKLRHEGIVTVFDLGEDAQRRFQFFTMEYVEGKTLHRVLAEHGGKLPLNEALDIVGQICDALHYAHHHTIHRDLKPQNIMVRPDGQVKVLDFGLAKLMSPGRLTKSSMALGTAYYQAPEQSIHARELDHRADIYSLGIMLYQMLTGEIPVGAVSSPSSLNPDIPRYLDGVIMRCIQPKPENRYASVHELSEALQSQPAEQKSRKLLWSLVSILLLLVAGVFGAYYVLQPILSPTELTVTTSAPAEVPPAPVPAPEPAAPPPEAPKPAPAPPAEAPTPEPLATVTAEAVSTARSSALKAKGDASAAGAEDHAKESFDAAAAALKEAEAHDTLKQFDQALPKYQSAETSFNTATKQATEVKQQLEALDKANAAMKTAKAKADALDAKTYAKARYQQAQESELQAGSSSDRVESAKRATEAAQLYDLSVTETQQQAEAVLAPLKKAAEEARKKAQTEEVRQYALKEFTEVEELWSGAVNPGDDLQAAKKSYEQTVKEYEKVIQLAADRKQAEADRLAQAQKEEEALKAEEARKAAESPQAGTTKTFDGFEMVWCPPGTFTMGSYNGDSDEKPPHEVMLTKGFWIGKYEVTQSQWEGVMGSNPSRFEGAKLPVGNVSWDDIQGFLQKLNAKGQGGFRLPTEAEWEYACRAGSTTEYCFGNDASGLGRYAWYGGNSGNTTHEVGTKQANDWNLNDMHGNVWEWCQDWKGDYPSGSVTDPKGPSSGQYRVLRGGSCYHNGPLCRSANRGNGTPDNRGNNGGFRIARTP